MSDDRIRIDRDELFSKEVDTAIRKDRELRRQPALPPPPISLARRILLSSTFYLSFAGFLGALITWMIVEPRVSDTAVIAGKVLAVDTEPVGLIAGAYTATVGSKDVVILPSLTAFEAGVDGKKMDKIEPGALIEVSSEVVESRHFALAVRPSTSQRVLTIGDTAESIQNSPWGYLLFPMTAALVVLFLFTAEGIACRNWSRMLQKALVGTSLTVLFSFIAFIPAGIFLKLRDAAMPTEPTLVFPPSTFIVNVACRSAAWCAIGIGLGFGMSLVRSTRNELRNAVCGGALGGAFGGLFFDPIDRFMAAQSLFADASTSRLVGLLAVGLSVGFFVALNERLAREAWVRVRSGPLTGKSFVLYRTPTIVGSSPQSDIYLFKDAEIDASHLAIHRVGNVYEVEDLGTRHGSRVAGQPLRRRQRVQSGDQLIVGNTVLEFEERAKSRTAGAAAVSSVVIAPVPPASNIGST